MSGPTGRRAGCRPVACGRSLVVMAAAACLAAGQTRGAEPTPARVGVGGVQRTGFWTPVVVDAADDAARCWMPDADGQLVGSPPLESADGAGGRTVVRPGRPDAAVVIGASPTAAGLPAEPAAASGSPSAGGRATAATIWPSTTPLLLVEGRFPAAAAAARLVAGDRSPAELVPLTTPQGVAPRTPLDLDAFDAALLSGAAAAALPAPTIAAIDGWVRRGGLLVLAAGRSAVALADKGSAVADWLPGMSPRLVPLRQFGAIEAFTGAGGLAKRAPPGGIEVPLFEGPEGVAGLIEVFEGSRPEDLPLVVRRAHGLGVIVWIAVDVDEPWCSLWPACDRLLVALLSGAAASEASLVVTRPGLQAAADLAGQLRIALESPAAGGAARAVPFEMIIGLGVLYVLALYPLDWWLVSRSGRPWISWLTLPVLAGGFVLASWALGRSWGLGEAASARVADVLDIDAAGGLARGSTWLAVRTPANGRVDVGIRPSPSLQAVPEPEAAVSWFADAGRGFGGVDAAVPHPSLAAGDYAYGPTLATLDRVPVAAASSRLFEANWTGRLPQPIVTSSLTRDARGLVHGTVAHHLPVPLADCQLIHGSWLYDVGDLEPGEVFDVEAGRGPRSLAAAVTRRKATGDRDQAAAWDPAATSVPRILEVAGLYEAVGGFAYTSLEPGRLGRLDLSGLLAVDRAVLVGTPPPGFRGSTWTIRLADDAGAVDELPPAEEGTTRIRIAVPLAAKDAQHSTGATP
jgi:hypothetical protein